jgi:thymidylate synthase
MTTLGEPDADHEYLRVLKRVLKDGTKQEGRNGEVRVCIGDMMRFSLENGRVPFISTKRLAWKTCLRELLWFIRGNTSATELAAEGCHIWDANGSREFLDSRGLTEYSEGELGPVYGHQWRRWGAAVGDNSGGVDQLGEIIKKLKDPKERYSRRLIVSAWNVSDLDKMALPPCHLLFQFHVTGDDELSCTTYQRSVDVGLGLPFNMASYGMLTHMIARAAGLRAKELVMSLANVHVYENHLDALREQATREPMPEVPHIDVESIPQNIDEVTFKDIKLSDYKHCGDIKMEMSA